MKIDIDLKIFMLMILTIFLTFMFVTGLWAVDTGVSAMNLKDGVSVSLSTWRTPADQYHTGLMLSALCFFSAICLTSYVLVRSVIKK